MVNGRIDEAVSDGMEPEDGLPKLKLVPKCDPPELFEPITRVLQDIVQERGRPLFALASGFIDEDVFEEVYRWKQSLREAGKDNNLDILINSPGGSLGECYRIARLFARYTDNWEALVPKIAQSGATLICLGSGKIVLSEAAQLRATGNRLRSQFRP